LSPDKQLVVDNRTHVDLVFEGSWFIGIDCQTVFHIVLKFFFELVKSSVFVQV
jgi:hypothetical protein